MKNWIVSILILGVMACSVPLQVFAQNTGQTEPEAIQIVRALGIMNGDQNGNLNLSHCVSRAEFVKMTIAASKYKDNIGAGEGVSLYRDVKSDHWASRYIQLAVNEGWFTGYTDGTFHPQDNIKLEEGATVILRLLGYTAEDLQGAFPSAQLAKFSALGLNADINELAGSNLTRLDCAKMFATLMVTAMKSGETYGAKLGYEIKYGRINYSALVNANTKGPFVVGTGRFTPPFKDGIIFKNNAPSSINKIAPNDVYYYNLSMHTVWVYDTKITGTLNEIGPNAVAPDKLTVAGKEYSLGTSTAAFSVSSSGNYRPGDVVTLLLGRNGEIVEILSADKAVQEYYGVVLLSEKESTPIGDHAQVRYKVKVACTDGVERIFFAKSAYTSIGNPVFIKYEDGEAVINNLPAKKLSGTITDDRFGSHRFAPNVQILDSDGKGGYMRVYPSRLKGIRLYDKHVLYYSLNVSDEIEFLILNNVTGDMEKYGLMTYVKNEESRDGMPMKGEYKWIMNKERGSLSVQNTMFNINWGGAKFEYKNGEISSIKSLTSVSLTEITALYGQGTNKKYPISEKVQVYMSTGNAYSPTNLSSVLNTDEYNFTGYIDEFGAPAGGHIRILVVSEK